MLITCETGDPGTWLAGRSVAGSGGIGRSAAPVVGTSAGAVAPGWAGATAAAAAGQQHGRRPAEAEQRQRHQVTGGRLASAEPQPGGRATAQRGLRFRQDRERKRGPGQPADVAHGSQKYRAVVPAQQGLPDVLPAGYMRRQRRAAEPVKQHRQPGYQRDQRDQRGYAAQQAGPPAAAAAAHRPGPVTPVTRTAVADSVAVIELRPMMERIFVGSVMVTVTRIEFRPAGWAVPREPAVARYCWAGASAWP